MLMALFESEDEIDGSDEQQARYEMVPAKRHVKSYRRENDKHQQGQHFLDDLQLHQRERSSVAVKTDAVCRYLQAVFKERDAPRKEDDEDERSGVREETFVLQFQVSVPRKRHEDIRRQE